MLSREDKAAVVVRWRLDSLQMAVSDAIVESDQEVDECCEAISAFIASRRAGCKVEVTKYPNPPIANFEKWSVRVHDSRRTVYLDFNSVFDGKAYKKVLTWCSLDSAEDIIERDARS